ncbi:MAG: M20/M25/M40 family metallo-hydrolase [Candidatus Marsarchaeota archaeon]|nr:M20/M25/M40 family metallo-hydrolase [Candidatus Marsarchaeota archaeon]
METYSRVDAAQPTSKDSELVLLLKNAVKDVKGITPGVTGIGGGTCASFFRKMGMDAAVWSTLEDTAHQPNEYARINCKALPCVSPRGYYSFATQS